MFNGLIYLLGTGENIPNIIARMLYSMSSREGTDNDDAKALVKMLSEYKKLPVKCEIYEGNKVTKKLVKALINEGNVIVCDTKSGNHSVLITKLNYPNNLLVFDPNWKSVTRRRSKFKNKYEILIDPTGEDFSPFHNIRVALDYFFSEKLLRLQWGVLIHDL